MLPIDGPRWPLTPDGDGYRIDDPLNQYSWHFAPVDGARRSVQPLVAIERDRLDRIDIDRDGTGTPTLLRHSAGSVIRLTTEQQRVTAIEVVDGDTQVQVAQFGYDDRSRLATVVNSSGTAAQYEYDTHGRMTGWKDRTGTWYRYVYDADGRCVRTVGPDGFYSGAFAYDREHLITVYTDSLGATSEYHFTATKQLSRRVGPSGEVVAYEWDRYDHLLSRTDPLGATTSFTYDEQGALATVTRPDGSVLEITQDAGGLTVEIEENGTRITRFYPEDEAPDPFEDVLGISAPMSYEQLAARSPANNDDSGQPQDRDVFGRAKSVPNKSRQPVVLGWTVEGQERLRVQPSGVRQTRRHDADGREIEHVNGAGVATKTEYGVFGLVTATIDGTGARTSYSYDTELRLASMTNPLGLTWTYRYDPAGNLVEETDFDGRTLSFAYDRAGQAHRIVQWGRRADRLPLRRARQRGRAAEPDRHHPLHLRRARQADLRSARRRRTHHRPRRRRHRHRRIGQRPHGDQGPRRRRHAPAPHTVWSGQCMDLRQRRRSRRAGGRRAHRTVRARRGRP